MAARTEDPACLSRVAKPPAINPEHRRSQRLLLDMHNRKPGTKGNAASPASDRLMAD